MLAPITLRSSAILRERSRTNTKQTPLNQAVVRVLLSQTDITKANRCVTAVTVKTLCYLETKKIISCCEICLCLLKAKTWMSPLTSTD